MTAETQIWRDLTPRSNIAAALEAPHAITRFGALEALAPIVARRAGVGGRVAPLYALPPAIAHTLEVRALYEGVDPYGAHLIGIRLPLMRGVGAICALAHEMAHAAQCEAAGDYRTFSRLYAQALKTASKAGADQRTAYLQNPYESEARKIGAEIAAEIAARLET